MFITRHYALFNNKQQSYLFKKFCFDCRCRLASSSYVLFFSDVVVFFSILPRWHEDGIIKKRKFLNPYLLKEKKQNVLSQCFKTEKQKPNQEKFQIDEKEKIKN